MVINKSFVETSLKAHHRLGTFLDPHFRRFEFLPVSTDKELVFRRRLLPDINNWILKHMEQVAADVQDSQDFAPPQKRVRSEVSQDPLNQWFSNWSLRSFWGSRDNFLGLRSTFQKN